MHKPQALTAEKLWPVVLSLGKDQMVSLFQFLSDHLYPWPTEKLQAAHKQVEEGNILSEEDFRKRFADYFPKEA